MPGESRKGKDVEREGTAAAVVAADLVDSTTSGVLGEEVEEPCWVLTAGQGVEGAPCVGKAIVFRLSLQEDAPCTDAPALVTRFCLQLLLQRDPRRLRP